MDKFLILSLICVRRFDRADRFWKRRNSQDFSMLQGK
jgi:hypothetical protein